MSGYYFYDKGYLPPNFGLANNGSICWWNSLLQTLLSLPAFNKLAIDLAGEATTSALFASYVKSFHQLLTSPRENNSSVSATLLGPFVYEAKKQKKNIDLGSQEGTTNGFCVFLELLNNNDVYRVFNNKYEQEIVCPKCSEITSIISDKSPLINIYDNPMLDSQEAFERYILFHQSEVDELTCEKCGEKSFKVRRSEKLKMLREIIVISFPKGSRQRYYPFELNFLSKDDKVLNYRLVAQIEHSGSYNPRTHQSGGHYFARVLRKNGWIGANDSSIFPTKPTPHCGVHMVFYHLVSHQ